MDEDVVVAGLQYFASDYDEEPIIKYITTTQICDELKLPHRQRYITKQNINTVIFRLVDRGELPRAFDIFFKEELLTVPLEPSTLCVHCEEETATIESGHQICVSCSQMCN